VNQRSQNVQADVTNVTACDSVLEFVAGGFHIRIRDYLASTSKGDWGKGDI